MGGRLSGSFGRGLKPEQTPAVDRALTALGGPDLVEILVGRGLGVSSHPGSGAQARADQETAN